MVPTSIRELVVDGRERRMVVQTPPDARGRLPLLLVFHGSNQTAEVFRRFTDGSFDALADEGRAVVASLDGYEKHWNDARKGITFAARTENVDDVAFTRAAVAALVADGAVDPARVYAFGFSNGGQLVVRLIHEAPDLIAGAAMVGATQPEPSNFIDSGAPVRSMPVLAIHGTRDPLVPYDGGMASLWGLMPRGRGLSAPDSAAYFARRNGITAEPTVTEIPPLEGSHTSVTRTEYRQDGHDPVTLLTVIGGGHTVPGPGRASLVMGRTSHEITALDEVAGFFGL